MTMKPSWTVYTNQAMRLAPGRETDIEVLEAICWLANGDEDEALRIWEEPTDAERRAIWERVTDNGLRDGDDYLWGVERLGTP